MLKHYSTLRHLLSITLLISLSFHPAVSIADDNSVPDINITAPEITQEEPALETAVNPNNSPSLSIYPKAVPTDAIECDDTCLKDKYPYALMADDIYHPGATYSREGWVRGTVTIPFYKDDLVGIKYQITNETWLISAADGFSAGLYVNVARQEVALVIRGTQAPSLASWFTNISQQLGVIPTQYAAGDWAAFQTLAYMQKNLPASYHLTVVGHSLGGGIAAFVASSFDNVKAVTFNPAPLKDNVLQNAPNYHKYITNSVSGNPDIQNVVHKRDGNYYIDNDIVSSLPGGLLGKTYALTSCKKDNQYFITPTDLISSALDLHLIKPIIDTLEKKIKNGNCSDQQAKCGSGTPPTYPASANIGKTGPGGGIIFAPGLEAQRKDANVGGYTGCSSCTYQDGSIAHFYTWEEAKTVASSYGAGWHLPTKDELNLLCQQQSVVGGFDDYYYWSSTETDANTAWYQTFDGGFQDDYNKYNQSLVRAVRAF